MRKEIKVLALAAIVATLLLLPMSFLTNTDTTAETNAKETVPFVSASSCPHGCYWDNVRKECMQLTPGGGACGG